MLFSFQEHFHRDRLRPDYCLIMLFVANRHFLIFFDKYVFIFILSFDFLFAKFSYCLHIIFLIKTLYLIWLLLYLLFWQKFIFQDVSVIQIFTLLSVLFNNFLLGIILSYYFFFQLLGQLQLLALLYSLVYRILIIPILLSKSLLPLLFLFRHLLLVLFLLKLLLHQFKIFLLLHCLL